jgi:hypothetical protein
MRKQVQMVKVNVFFPGILSIVNIIEDPALPSRVSKLKMNTISNEVQGVL